MTLVKICGITRWEDARTVVDAGADMLGFVFYPRSPRYITPERASEIARRLPSSIRKVGVFVDEALETVREIRETCSLDVLQMHGNESPAYCESFGNTAVVKAFRMKSEQDIRNMEDYSNVEAVLVDGRHPDFKGGTGVRAPWELLRDTASRFRLILAGGLDSTNVAQALSVVNPFGVDVSSGVEVSPGIKNPEKIREFVAEVREFDRRGRPGNVPRDKQGSSA